MGIFKRLAWFFREQRRNYAVGILALFMTSLMNLVPPKVIGSMVDAMNDHAMTARKLILWLGLLLVAAILQFLFRYGWRIHIWVVPQLWNARYGRDSSGTSCGWIPRSISGTVRGT